MNLFRADLHYGFEDKDWDDFEYIQADSFAEAEAIVNAYIKTQAGSIDLVALTFVTSRVLSRKKVMTAESAESEPD